MHYGSAVAVGPDGTVFFAGRAGFRVGGGGLRAYSYDGSSFIITAHDTIDYPYSRVTDIAVDSDVVFLTTSCCGGIIGTGHLGAFSYDGSSFTNKANIGGVRGYIAGLAVGLNGIVFLANTYYGLRAYLYNDSSFSIIDEIENGLYTGDVAFGPDGTVFTTNGENGLWAYSFNDSSFSSTAHVAIGNGFPGDIVAGPNGTVFLANGNDGLRAYLYDGSSFTNTAHAPIDSGNAQSVTIGLDGTVFLANGSDGLRAYLYDGSSFTNTAHAPIDSGSAQSVTIGPDGTVFLATGNEGLFAYRYSFTTAVANEFSGIPQKFELVQNYPNPFNPSTNIGFSIPKNTFVTLKVYNILGQEVATILSQKLYAGNYNYSWNAGSLSSGVYTYKLEAGDFVESRKMILLQ